MSKAQNSVNSKISLSIMVMIAAVQLFSNVAGADPTHSEDKEKNKATIEWKEVPLAGIKERNRVQMDLCKPYLAAVCTQEYSPAVCQYKEREQGVKPTDIFLVDGKDTKSDITNTKFKDKIPVGLLTLEGEGDNPCKATNSLKFQACIAGFKTDPDSLSKRGLTISCGVTLKQLEINGGKLDLDTMPK